MELTDQASESHPTAAALLTPEKAPTPDDNVRTWWKKARRVYPEATLRAWWFDWAAFFAATVSGGSFVWRMDGGF